MKYGSLEERRRGKPADIWISFSYFLRFRTIRDCHSEESLNAEISSSCTSIS
jgi:hypothetical protein